jgi:PIN domain nuclease of toxin-antitoxin system
MASYWELCIKHSIGKLELAPDWQKAFDREMAINGIRWLAIEKEHCQGIVDLPLIHGDPFDRLLIAQARQNDLKILTGDHNLTKYDVDTIM